MKLSVRARESIKTGLAMAVAIAISLRMDFLEPAWAGFAVAMISLDTAGQSLNKAALRMVGTLVGFVASLSFIGLFPQQRWGLLLALSPYIGLCTYMLAGKKNQYAWFVAAFVCLTIMTHGGADSPNVFRYAVARVEETALGILVYALISIFLWPQTSRGGLDAASRALLDTQLRLFRAYRGLLAGRGRVEESRPLRLQEVQRLTQLGQALNAAATDTYAVWELRHTWRRLLQQSTVLAETLGRWRVSLPEIQTLDLARFLPGVEDCCAELERRLEQTARLLAGDDAEAPPRNVDLSLVQSQIDAASHFEKAAVALFLTQLKKLDAVSRALFDSAQEIVGAGPLGSERSPPRAFTLALDPDRFRSAVTVLATMWTGFLIWVWVDPSGHSSFVYNAVLFAMMAMLGRQRPHTMFPGLLLGLAAGGVAYIGVMPHLSGYTELGLMLFCATAGGVYLFWDPRQRGTKSLYLAMLLIVTSIENEQSYSFSVYANTVTAAVLSLALASAVAFFPSSPRPEKVFLRLLARFFRHAELLMSRLAPEADRRNSVAARWRSVWYRNDLLEIPEKLATLAEQIDYRLLSGTAPDRVRALVMNLVSLTLRIKELLDAREHVHPDPRIEQVVQDLRDWRLLAQQQFRQWAADPAAALAPEADMSERLTRRLARIEADLDEARARAGREGFRVDYEALYRYLGAFRGLSQDAIGYAGVAAAMDWQPWREARF